MKEILKAVAKKVLLKSGYASLRSRFVFNDLDSPFPMSKVKDFDMDWGKYDQRDKQTRVVYIVSPTQRSGTNFLSHVLGKHPQLVFPSKDKFPNEHCLYTYIEDIKKYCYKTVRVWSKWTENGPNPLESQAKSLMSSIGNGMLDYFSHGLKEDQLLLFKTPDAGHLEDYFHLFPNSKVVILMRDGRDTIESFRESWGGDGSFIKMTKRWNDRVEQIEKFKNRSVESGFDDQVYSLNYEDLNVNSHDELQKVFDFLNIDGESYPWKELDETPVLGSSNFRGGQGDVHWNPIVKDDNFKPTGKWESWSGTKKRVFKKVAGEQLKKLGYSKDNNW